ncbi:endonuclease VII [Mycobacterium phage Briton15]|nr:endonuclease VII [Mycobacterium phage Briton15]
MAAAKPKPRRCVDCAAAGITTRRAAPHPGPRCATHHREKRAVRKDTAWEKRLLELYDITADEYWQIYEAQGGRCYICRKGRGLRKKLAVDHDHRTGHVRGLLDTPCNRNVLGHLGDDPEALQRGIDYLENPPAFAVIGKRIAPIEVPNLNRNGRKPTTGRKRKT